MTKLIKWLLIAFVLNVLSSSEGQAATINAASCSSAAVQTAINLAVDGDTVSVPVGNCTWTAAVSTSNKRITLKGSGSGTTGTVITASNTNRLNIPNNVGQTITVRDMRFLGVAGTSGLIRITGTVKDFRITGMHFEWTSDGGSPGGMLRIEGLANGVIDHNTFAPITTQEFRSAIYIEVDSTANAFARPSALGTANSVYVEDNVFTQPAPVGLTHAMFSQQGGSYVFRYNTVTNWDVDVHGHCTWHGGREFEVYNNTFTATGNYQSAVVVLRGGTGVAYNNTFTSNGFTMSTLRLRMHEIDAGSACHPAVGGACYACTYPVNYQLGRGTNNVLDPVYLWNNKRDGVFVSPEIFPSTADPACPCLSGLNVAFFCQQNRDYFTSNATPKPGYTAFTYPHPLTVTNSRPTPPASLRVN